MLKWKQRASGVYRALELHALQNFVYRHILYGWQQIAKQIISNMIKTGLLFLFVEYKNTIRALNRSDEQSLVYTVKYCLHTFLVLLPFPTLKCTNLFILSSYWGWLIFSVWGCQFANHFNEISLERVLIFVIENVRQMTSCLFDTVGFSDICNRLIHLFMSLLLWTPRTFSSCVREVCAWLFDWQIEHSIDVQHECHKQGSKACWPMITSLEAWLPSCTALWRLHL